MFGIRVLCLVILLVGISHGWDMRHRIRRAIQLSPVDKEGITAQEEIDRAMSNPAGFEKFKNAVLPKLKAEWMKKDVILVKYFNAAYGIATAAIAIVEETLAWREAHKMDTILKEDHSAGLALFGNAGIKGQDLAGRPILYENFGLWKLSEAIQKGEQEKYERTFYYVAELLAEEIVKQYEAGGKYSRLTAIFDFDNWKLEDGMCTDCTPIMVRLGSAFDGKYPHGGHRWLCINTPIDFRVFLDIVRVVLSKQTNEILIQFSRQKSSWKPELHKLVDPKVLKDMMHDKEGYEKDFDYTAGFNKLADFAKGQE